MILQSENHSNKELEPRSADSQRWRFSSGPPNCLWENHLLNLEEPPPERPHLLRLYRSAKQHRWSHSALIPSDPLSLSSTGCWKCVTLWPLRLLHRIMDEQPNAAANMVQYTQSHIDVTSTRGFPVKMVILHIYVSLPQGNSIHVGLSACAATSSSQHELCPTSRFKPMSGECRQGISNHH